MDFNILDLMSIATSLITIGVVLIRVGQMTRDIQGNKQDLDEWMSRHRDGCPALSYVSGRVDKLESLGESQRLELHSLGKTLSRLEVKMDILLERQHPLTTGMRGSCDV